jgi:hypothetical protein
MLGGMSEDARSPARYAADIDAARERLVAFAGDCADDQWKAAPLDVGRAELGRPCPLARPGEALGDWRVGKWGHDK